MLLVLSCFFPRCFLGKYLSTARLLLLCFLLIVLDSIVFLDQYSCLDRQNLASREFATLIRVGRWTLIIEPVHRHKTSERGKKKKKKNRAKTNTAELSQRSSRLGQNGNRRARVVRILRPSSRGHGASSHFESSSRP